MCSSQVTISSKVFYIRHLAKRAELDRHKSAILRRKVAEKAKKKNKLTAKIEAEIQ
jgi:hypothetical protein